MRLFHVALFAFFSVFLFPTASALKCYQCEQGAENIPKFARKALAQLNITAASGDCKSTCSNGTFCIKRAKVYQISYSGVSLKWTSYSKGCATLREDNSAVPTDTCYDLGQVSNSTTTTGYTSKRVDCYCQKDLCNSSPSVFFPLRMAVSLLAMLSLRSVYFV